MDKGSRVSFVHCPHGPLCVGRTEQGTVLGDNGDGTLLVSMDAREPATLRTAVVVDAADCSPVDAADDAAAKRAAEELAAAEAAAADASATAARAKAKVDAAKARAKATA